MKTYTLKLVSGTDYNLYDGTTLVSDTDLATLFTTAGSAYFVFDFNSGTPSATDALTIVDSNSTAVITNTGLSGIAEDINFKGDWSASATAFDTFVKLGGIAMDEAQLMELMGKIKEGPIIVANEAGESLTVDKAWISLSSTKPGIYKFQDGASFSFAASNSQYGSYSFTLTSMSSPAFGIVLNGYGSDRKSLHLFSMSQSNPPSCLISISVDIRGSGAVENVVDYRPLNTLDSDLRNRPLSAKQGKTLKDLIDSLVIKNTGAPTTSTVGTVGKLYEDTTNGKLYQCTNVSGNTYTWTEITKTSITSKVSQTVTDDLSSLQLAGSMISGAPFALMTSDDSSDTLWSYARSEFFGNDIGSAYVGGYLYDKNEDWWSGKKEARLALYSDLDGRVKQNAGAPTTSTTGSKGQLLEDTTNGKLYQCTAVTPGTAPDPDTYTWTEVGGGSLADTTTFWGQAVSNGHVSGNIDLGTPTLNNPKTVSANDGKVQVIFGHDNPDNGYEYVRVKATNNLTSKTATLEVMAENDAYISSNVPLYMGSKQIKNLADGTENTDAVNKGQMDDRILAGGTSAPTTSTVGKVGTLYGYVESGTGHLAICTAVSGSTYTWATLI